MEGYPFAREDFCFSNTFIEKTSALFVWKIKCKKTIIYIVKGNSQINLGN